MAIVSLDDLISKTNIEDEFNSSMQTQQQQQLNQEKIEEQKQRREYRGKMYWCFFALLIFQHLLLVTFVIGIFCAGALSNLQPLLAIIIPATLGETYIIMRQMVQFIFQPGDFRLDRKDNEG